MGKDLKGKELGEGVLQRKNGKYYARYTDSRGKRCEKYFDKPTDARKFVAIGKLQKESGDDIADQVQEFTVDEWYMYWMKTFKRSLSPNTQRNYRDRYERDIKPKIGKMIISDVKPLHCQKIFNDMEDKYASGTIYQTYICLGSMMKSALQNGIIERHPMNGVVMPHNSY